MYKKIRFALRFLTALLTKYYLLIFLGLLVGILAFFFTPHIFRLIPILRPVQRIGIIGKYTLNDLPLSIQKQMSIGLSVLDPSGIPSPGLASRWIATDSGKTYIFTLNPNSRWQDGSIVKSRDIKYNFKDAKVEYPNSNTLVIKLPDSFAPLPTVVSRPVFKYPNFPRRYIGLGSYTLSSYKRNGVYLDSIILSPVNNDRLPVLKYTFFASQSQGKTAFRLGLLDSVQDISDLSDLDKWPNVNIKNRILKDRYVAVFFNVDDPAFTGASGKNLRMALSYGVDKSRWPLDTRTTGPIGSDSWAYNPDVKTYEFDLSKAKQLLQKVEKLPEKINLSVVPSYLEVGDLIKHDWEDLGVKVNLLVTPDVPDNFQALVVAQAIPNDPDQYNLWHSTQDVTNLTNLKNPRIDKLLEDGRKSPSQEDRKNIYFDFQRFLAEECPAIFLFYPQTFTIQKK